MASYCSIDTISSLTSKFKNKLFVIFFVLILVACGKNSSENSEVTQVPPALNTAPVVNAGSDQQVDGGETVSLSGTGSDNEGVVTYSWSQISGPQVTLNQNSIANPSFIAPNVDTDTSITLEVTVSDGEGLTATDTVLISIKASGSVSVNTPPTVNAGVDQTVDEGNLVQLSATGSDPEGSIVVTWEQISGPSVQVFNSSILSPTFIAPDIDVEQAIVLQVTATDEMGVSVMDNVEITIQNVAANNPPTINAGVDQTVDEENLVQLSATGSDPEGSIVVTWEQISGPSVQISNSSILTPTFIAPAIDVEQAIVLQITATDESGVSVQDSVEITIQIVAANIPPEVNAGEDQQVVSGELVNLVASASDEDGNITSYMWTQISGDVANILDSDKAAATFEAPIVTEETELTFEVTVSDDAQALTSDTLTIVVLPPQPNVLIGEGFIAPGLQGEYEITDIIEVAFGSDGQIALTAEVTNSSNQTLIGLWLGFPDALRLVVKTGDNLPTLPVTIQLSGVSNLSLNGKGELLFSAQLIGAVNNSTELKLMYANQSELQAVEVSLPQELVDNGFYSSFVTFSSGYKMTNAGAMIAQGIDRSGSFFGSRGHAIWFWTPSESTLVLGSYTLAQFGERLPLPMSPIVNIEESCTTDLSGVVIQNKLFHQINNLGDMVFLVNYESDNDVVCPEGLILKWSNGAYTRVVENGQLIPNMPNLTFRTMNTIFTPSTFSLSDRGDISFINVLADGSSPTVFSLFVAKSSGDIEFLFAEGENLPNTPASSLFFNFIPSMADNLKFSEKFGYLIPLRNQSGFEEVEMLGKPISNPYETISDIADSHLLPIVSVGDQAPGFPATSYFNSAGLKLVDSRMNSSGNIMFFAYVTDVTAPDNFSGAGFWNINSDTTLQNVIKIGDEVANVASGNIEQLLLIQDFVLTDSNQIVALGQLTETSKGIIVFNPILE